MSNPPDPIPPPEPNVPGPNVPGPNPREPNPPEPALPPGVIVREARPSDAGAIAELMRPYVAQRLLLERTEAEIIALTRHGFVAEAAEQCVGFSAIEIYSPKLAELQCLAVHADYRRGGVGRVLVARCIDRARELRVMEVMAISSSETFLRACGFDYSLPDQKKALFCQLRPRHSH